MVRKTKIFSLLGITISNYLKILFGWITIWWLHGIHKSCKIFILWNEVYMTSLQVSEGLEKINIEIILIPNKIPCNVHTDEQACHAVDELIFSLSHTVYAFILLTRMWEE